MSLKYSLLLISLILSISMAAQVNELEKKNADTVIIYNYVEQMPSPGFDLPAYIAKKLHCHPDSSQAINDQITLKFVVNEDGGISNIEVRKSISQSCDEAAISMVKLMPPWIPGRKNGKNVKVWFFLPIQIDWQ